jgi:hypothetical protein
MVILIPLVSPTDRPSRQKNHQGDSRINWHHRSNGLNGQLQNITPKSAVVTFFLAAHGTFSKVDHILGHKARLNKYNNIEITSYILSDYNGRKLEIKNRSHNRKYCNIWRRNNSLLNDQWVSEEIREEIFKSPKIEWKWKHNLPELLGHNKGSVRRNVYSHGCLHLKKTKKFQINNLIMHLKLLEKQVQAKPKSSRWKEVIKTSPEINEIET